MVIIFKKTIEITKEITNMEKYECEGIVVKTEINTSVEISDAEEFPPVVGSNSRVQLKDGFKKVVEETEYLTCPQCKRSYNKRSLTRHIKTVHEKVKEFKCDRCLYACSQRTNLRNHINAVHEKKREFKCELCEFTAVVRSKLKYHIKSVHEKILDHKCGQCDYATYKKHKLQEHEKGVHDKIKRYKCDQCDYAAFKKDNVDEHVKRVHGKLKCLQCEFSCSGKLGKSILSTHMRKAHYKIDSYKCDQCTREFSSRAIMHVHLKNSHEVQDFKCWQCDFICSTKSTLSTHVKKIHDLYKCDHCSDEFSKRWLLKRHSIRVHCTKDYKCDQCEHATSHQGDLSQHVEKVHGPKSFLCSRCSSKFPGQRELKRHEKAVHDQVRDYKCDKCDYATARKDNLADHITRVHGEKGFKCVCCENVYSSKKELILHLAKVHEKLKVIECDECDYATSKGKEMKRHVEKQHLKKGAARKEDTIHKCDQCNYASSNRSKLVRHVRGVHNKIKDYKCDQCSYAWTNKRYLMKHLKEVHNVIREYTCEQCDYVSTDKALVAIHEKRVHGKKLFKNRKAMVKLENNLAEDDDIKQDEKGHKCDQCDYAAPDKITLWRHIFVCGNSNTFQCNMCHLKFRDRGTLNRHVKCVHNKIKDYKCEKCDRAFSRKGNLESHCMRAHGMKRHEKAVHHKTKGYKCEKCDYAGARKDNLADHFMRMHGKKVTAKSDNTLSSGMEIWVNNELKQEKKDNHEIEDTDDPLNLNGMRIPPHQNGDTQKNSRPDVNISVQGKTFSKKHIHKVLQMDDNSAAWIRKKAAISIAHCGSLNLQDLTFITFQGVSVGEQGVKIKLPQSTKEFVLPISQNNDLCLMASLVTIYLDCLKRGPRALGPADQIFNPARKEELCNLGQEVAALLGLDHPELYSGDCFTPGLNSDEDKVTEEGFSKDETLMNEWDFKEEAV